MKLRLVGKQDTELAVIRPDLVDNGWIEFLGGVDDEVLAELYRDALAFVYPTRYDGFGIPPLEAQQSGCLVITADLPITREVLGTDSPMFVNLDDLNEFSEILIRLAYSPDQAELASRRRAGLENARRYSWAESARKLSALIDDCDRASS